MSHLYCTVEIMVVNKRILPHSWWYIMCLNQTKLKTKQNQQKHCPIWVFFNILLWYGRFLGWGGGWGCWFPIFQLLPLAKWWWGGQGNCSVWHTEWAKERWFSRKWCAFWKNTTVFHRQTLENVNIIIAFMVATAWDGREKAQNKSWWKTTHANPNQRQETKRTFLCVCLCQTHSLLNWIKHTSVNINPKLMLAMEGHHVWLGPPDSSCLLQWSNAIFV